MTSNVLRPVKRSWQELRRARPGERFRHWHDTQQSKARPWVRPLYLAGAVVCLGVGVVLTVMPGPAVVFFAFTAALLAAQSATVARVLDAAELRARAALRALRK